MTQRIALVCTLLCCSFLMRILDAQIRSASITGSVVDPTGAVIIDAEVIATNTGTNVSASTRTTTAGAYTIPYLEAGTYTITVKKVGFETFQESGIRLRRTAPDRQQFCVGSYRRAGDRRDSERDAESAGLRRPAKWSDAA